MTFSKAELNSFHNFVTVFPLNFCWQRIQVLPLEGLQKETERPLFGTGIFSAGKIERV